MNFEGLILAGRRGGPDSLLRHRAPCKGRSDGCFAWTRFSRDGSWFFKVGPGFPKCLGPGNSHHVFLNAPDELQLLL